MIIRASILISILYNTMAYSQDGTLDVSFDIDGKVTNNLGAVSAFANVVKIQSDGKIVVAGHVLNNNGYDAAIVRYNSSGALDTLFNHTGIVIISTSGNLNDKIYGLVIQSNGKIIISGDSDGQILAVRLNTDGSIDNTFANAGVFQTNIIQPGIQNTNSYGTVVALQLNGKILLASQKAKDAYPYYDYCVTRIDSSGIVDLSFGVNGAAFINMNEWNVDLEAISLQSDGKILLAGNSNFSTSMSFGLVRLNNNGILDTTFNHSGIVTTTMQATGVNGAKANSIAIQADGKIILGGNVNNFSYGLSRYNTDGSIDSLFNQTGKVIFSTGINGVFAHSMILQNDGKIIQAGSSLQNGATDQDFSLIRNNSNGSIDSTFDNDGIVFTNFNSNSGDQINSMALQSDGKIIAVGVTNSSSGSEIAIARYNNTVVTALNSHDITSYDLKIFPNPFNQIINIKFTNCNSKLICKISDMLGNIVLEEEIDNKNHSIHTDSLPIGMYIININNAYNYKILKNY